MIVTSIARTRWFRRDLRVAFLTAVCLGVLAGTVAKGAEVTLKIARIWSDQFPGDDFNGLPVNSANNRGPGSTGAELGRIVMATRADAVARVKAEIALDSADPTLADRVQVQLRRSDDGTTVLASAKPVAGVASLETPFTGGELDAEVVAWVDLDNDGAVSAGESLVHADGQFAIIGKTGYTGAVSSLRLITTVGAGSFPLPTATRLLSAFLSGKAPDGSASLPAALVHPDRDLDQNTGVLRQTDGTALVPQYEFAGTSDVAARICQSVALKKIVMNAIAREAASMQAAFGRGETSFEAPLFSAADPSFIEFPASDSAGDAWTLDTDLYYSFHFASLAGAKFVVVRDLADRVRVEGRLTDTYDFERRPGASSLVTLAANVQAGFGTLGTSGGVFGLTVQLAGEIQNVRWDGRPSLKIDVVSVLKGVTPDGARVRIECVHQPGQAVEIDKTTDFVTWEKVAQDVAGSSGMAILVDPVTAPVVFYRARAL
ncbi:MAG TPA: hypothetical protein VHH73_18355 [Verrucomicrobiae bacterium]|nr:hypothetical protein [Verrucomicrobiae bacterium]